ncbi:MAG: hypothetical protein ACHQIM_09365 [Sphingobacteriales bacterium]
MEKATIEKVKESCKTTSEAVSDRFVDVIKTILMPKKINKNEAAGLKGPEEESADILNSILHLI